MSEKNHNKMQDKQNDILAKLGATTDKPKPNIRLGSEDAPILGPTIKENRPSANMKTKPPLPNPHNNNKPLPPPNPKPVVDDKKKEYGFTVLYWLLWWSAMALLAFSYILYPIDEIINSTGIGYLWSSVLYVSGAMVSGFVSYILIKLMKRACDKDG
jgi:hypothetical protein